MCQKSFLRTRTLKRHISTEHVRVTVKNTIVNFVTNHLHRIEI